jgi:hypothetical protein
MEEVTRKNERNPFHSESDVEGIELKWMEKERKLSLGNFPFAFFYGYWFSLSKLWKE